MRLISLRNRIRSGWLTVLATAAVVALAAPGNAQTVPPTPAGAAPSADLAKVHLTAARNALSDVTQLPAAAQLTGETRTRVQQLITKFQRADWQERLARPLCEGGGQSLDTARQRDAGACDGHARRRGNQRCGGGSRPRDPREARRVPRAPGHVQDGGERGRASTGCATSSSHCATCRSHAASCATCRSHATTTNAGTRDDATCDAARDDAARAHSAHSSTHAATGGSTSGLARPETGRAVTGSRRQRRWAGRFRCGARSASSRRSPRGDPRRAGESAEGSYRCGRRRRRLVGNTQRIDPDDGDGTRRDAQRSAARASQGAPRRDAAAAREEVSVGRAMLRPKRRSIASDDTTVQRCPLCSLSRSSPQASACPATPARIPSRSCRSRTWPGSGATTPPRFADTFGSSIPPTLMRSSSRSRSAPASGTDQPS